ncbi:uncharacterized protein LOC111790494 isoform X1 [Cucurbita pepo subsp. pepo]|uniref:uncharacterized protein LOC111790494 isoform X1 n=1 Tax=Cucurbita pepo subsp. pepo TaxID=3664 RepID=UPI000C9D941D|nr:uncharacterized protein LOC111790494 isoform X1 [Cucurbita pepo subsp. pepo]
MGEALFELEQVLRSKQNSLTIEEANVLQTCKSKAVRDFTFGFLVGGGVTWAGTWRLNKFVRLNLSGGAGALFGLRRFSRSLSSCVDHILALDGSRMQKELANIVVTKYHNDPRTMQHISKHFFYEEVFDDSTLDRPKIRWRYRNFFSDDVAHAQRTHYNDPKDNLHGNHHDSSNRDSNPNQSDSYGDPDDKGNAFEFTPVLTKPGADAATADPLDYIFGTMTREEEIQHSSASSPSPKSHHRSKRYNRRHRRHNQTMPTDFEHV